jgi:hypothetical protein
MFAAKHSAKHLFEHSIASLSKIWGAQLFTRVWIVQGGEGSRQGTREEAVRVNGMGR